MNNDMIHASRLASSCEKYLEHPYEDRDIHA